MNRCISWRARAVAVISVAGLVLSSAGRAQQYQPIDLGNFGGADTRAFGLSTNTQIVGSAMLPSGYMHAFRWVSPGPLQDLQTLGGPESRAIAVNLNGKVTGWTDLADGTWRAFIWDSVGGMKSIGTLGGSYSEGYGITNGDVIVGWSETGSGSWEAFMWDPVNKMRSLGTLGGEFSQALAINRAGKVVGGSQDYFGNWQAFLWDPVNKMRPLGFLGGSYSSANDVNVAGYVVGCSELADASTQAFIWDPVYHMQPLGTLGGSYSDAAAVNSGNQVVGTSTRKSGNAHAFIWDSMNGMRDLNSLLPANSGWELLSAEGINDLGEIIGYGYFQGKTRAFYLVAGQTQLGTVSVNPANAPGGSSVEALVSLTGPAPSGGFPVTLTSSNPVAQVSGASTVIIPAGSAGAKFTLTTFPVTSPQTSTITATSGTAFRTATLVVRPVGPAQVSLSPSSVLGGETASGTVTLETAATPTDITVLLTGHGVAKPNPIAVTVPYGQKTASFSVTTSPVTATEVDAIEATTTDSGVKASADLTVNAPEIDTVTLDPTIVAGGSSSTGTIKLTGPAPAAGFTIKLASGNTAVATVPTTVTVPATEKSITFPITTYPVTSSTTVKITATLGTKSKSADLSVRNLAVQSLSLNPSSVSGGNTSIGTVTLTLAAPAGGFKVNLSSTNNTVAPVPAYVMVPSGSTTVDFPINTTIPAAQTTVTISAASGNTVANALLTVLVPDLSALQVKPTTVSAGDTATGTVTLSSPALKGGYLVNLVSSDTSVATVPASITIPEGSTSLTFGVNAKAVPGNHSVTITASHGAVSRSASILVTEAKLSGITITPSTIASGQSTTGRVTLSAPAPAGGFQVDVACSNPNLATVPATVTVPQGQTFVEFKVSAMAVTRDATVTISATQGTTVVSAPLTIRAWKLTSFTLNPSSVKGGTASTGTVTISSPAPAGGVYVQVSVYAGPASVASAVLIPEGKSSATFSVATEVVSMTDYATLLARGGAVSLTATLTITP